MHNQPASAAAPGPPPIAPRGFTLIELMIVVAIIAILAAVAMPSYIAYTIRAKLSEAIVFADACKVAVQEHFAAAGGWPANLAASGCVNARTDNVVSALDVTDGRIDVTIYGTRTGIGSTCHLYLTPNADGSQWTGSTSCPPQYLPTNFR